MRLLSRARIFLSSILGMRGFVYAADLSSQPAPTIATGPGYSFDRFEIRGGVLSSVHAPENGDINLNGEPVLPKFVRVSGWQDSLVARLNVGGMANVSGGTSCATAASSFGAHLSIIDCQNFDCDSSFQNFSALPQGITEPPVNKSRDSGGGDGLLRHSDAIYRGNAIRIDL
jgi:hypothetical protein